MAFNPIHNHFIKFHSGSFNQGFPIGANLIQDCFAHNLEWIYGNSSQFLINTNGSLFNYAFAASGTVQYQLIGSMGPFPISLNKEKKPLPLYAEIAFRLNTSNNITGSIRAELRYFGNTGSYGAADVGMFTNVTGSGNSGGAQWQKFTTTSSSFGATSSIIHFPSGMPPQYFDIGAIDPGYVSSSNTYNVAFGVLDLYYKTQTYSAGSDTGTLNIRGFVLKEINTRGTGSL